MDFFRFFRVTIICATLNCLTSDYGPHELVVTPMWDSLYKEERDIRE